MSNLACAIIESVAVIVLGLLAYHFDKWWIVLFSYLFLFTLESSRRN